MTPDERQLIADLFERVRSTGPIDKDREAEAFISQYMRSTPDAAYKLVQSVLVQEGALQDQQARIEELESHARQLEDQLAQYQQPQQPARGGSFLGGARQAQPAASSVPPAGQRSPGFGQPSGSPWGRQQQAGYAPAQQPAPQPVQAQSSGGGFFRSAMATAAGVAGGVLAAGAIRDMFGGGSQAHASGSRPSDAASSEPSPYEVTPASQPQEAEPEYNYQSEEDNDPGNTDEGSFGGGDDVEI